MKVTRPPTPIVTSDGVNVLLDVMVMVAVKGGGAGGAGVGGGVGVVAGGGVDAAGGVGAVGAVDPPPAHADTATSPARTSVRAIARKPEPVREADQKNFLDRLKPRYQSSLLNPPRAICASVVAKLFEKFNWNMWPPARFSMPKLTCVTPGS